jgi:hypothetical protein
MGLQDLFGGEGVLVQETAKGHIEFGQLAAKGVGTLEKGLDTDSPELLVVGCGIGIQEIGLAGLHTFEDRPGDGRKFSEMIMKDLVAAFPDRKIHVGERMRHFVEAYILSIGIIGEFPEKMGPGKIDAVFAHMTFEGCFVQSIAVSVFQDMDSPEIVEQVMFQAIGQLYGRGAYEQGHAFIGLDIDILEGLDPDKMLYACQKAVFSGSIEAGIVGVAAGKEGIIIAGFGFEEAALFLPSRPCHDPRAHAGKRHGDDQEGYGMLNRDIHSLKIQVFSAIRVF